MAHKIDSKSEQASFLSYGLGYIFSIILTLAAYLLVVNKLATGSFLISAVIVLAIVQLVVQLKYFLHIGFNSQSRSSLFIFFFMLLVVFILVGGTLWIMKNLNHSMQSPSQTDSFIIKDEGVAK